MAEEQVNPEELEIPVGRGGALRLIMSGAHCRRVASVHAWCRTCIDMQGAHHEHMACCAWLHMRLIDDRALCTTHTSNPA